jgi:hypothetical protein
MNPRPRMIPRLNRAEKRTVRVATDKNRDPRYGPRLSSTRC